MYAVLDRTMTLDEVKGLNSNDVGSLCFTASTVEESGEHLDEYYQRNSRPIRKGSSPVTGMFWGKVGELVDVLKASKEWPLPPLMVRDGMLYDGHHRANAAILAGWDKPIPVTTSWMASGGWS